ncbi:MAG: hypothetical protein KDD19_17370 [Phaeodactylibacter sp.]|nr:hypothetical protein [Phaeodactylibacter sp.]
MDASIIIAVYLIIIVLAAGVYYYKNPTELAPYLSASVKKIPRLKLEKTLVRWLMLTLLLVAFYIFLLTTNIQIFPDFLGVLSTDYLSSLDLIIGSLASLSGIVIAVLIISYEILKSKVGRHSQRYFFGNLNLILLTFLFTFSISIAFISKVLVSSSAFYIDNQLNVVYYSYLLFLGCLIFLVPVSIRILFSFNIYKVIREEIKRISLKEIFNVSATPYYIAGIEFDSQKEKSPLAILRELAIKNLEKDYVITKAISREVAFRFIDILKEAIKENDRGELDFSIMKDYGSYVSKEMVYFFKPYVDILSGIISGAVRTNNNEVLDSIIIDFYYILGEASNLKLDLDQQKYVIDSFVKYCITISKTKNEDLFHSSLTILEKVIIKSLKVNRLDEEKINELYESHKAPKGDTEEGFKWTLIYDQWINAFQKILKDSIETNNEFAFNTVSIYILSLLGKMSKAQYLGPLQKDYVVVRQYMHLCFNCLKAIKDGFNRSKITLGINSPLNSFITTAIRENSSHLRKLLLSTGNYIIELARLNAIDLGILFELEDILNWLQEKQENKLAKQGLLYMLKIVASIKEQMEKSLESNSDAYDQLRKIVTKFSGNLNKANDLQLRRKLQKMERSFIEIPKLKWIDGHGYIKWEEEE